jgi:hypothetical protein
MTLPRVGLDPVMVQTFDMVQKWGAKGAARGTIVKRFTRESFRIVERRFSLMVKSLLAQSLGAVQDRHLYLKHGTKK